MIEATRLRLHDLTIAEFAATDMQWWHELAQAVTSWSHGRTAGGHGLEQQAPDEQDR